MTQQHLSQIEKGKRSLSLDQRRRAVEELGIAPEDLGLASERHPQHVSPGDASPERTFSRVRWQAERCWLNKHRSELAQLAAQLYPPECRVPRTPLIAPPSWIVDEPVDLEEFA